jgi:hypothetical protein
MFTRARLPGFWILGSVVSPAEFEHIDDYSAALDSAGGTYALGAALILGGAGVHFSGTNHHVLGSATLTVDSLGSIVVASGGMIKLDGTSNADIELKVTAGVASINVKAGAQIDVQKSGGLLNIYGLATLKDNGGGAGGELLVEDTATIQLASGASLSAASGTTVTLGGTTNVSSTGTTTWQNGSNLTSGSTAFAQWSGEWWFAKTLKITSACDIIIQGSTNWIQYETARDWTKGISRVVPLSFNGSSSGPADPDIWEETSDLTTAVCARTTDRTASGGKSLLPFYPPPVGGVITGATITSKGTQPGSIASTRPTYVIVSWEDSSSSGYTTHSSITTDAGSIATFGLTETQTEITATGSTGDRTVVAGRSYGLLVTHPYEAINTQGARFYEAHLLGTAAEHQI